MRRRNPVPTLAVEGVNARLRCPPAVPRAVAGGNFAANLRAGIPLRRPIRTVTGRPSDGSDSNVSLGSRVAPAGAWPAERVGVAHSRMTATCAVCVCW